MLELLLPDDDDDDDSAFLSRSFYSTTLPGERDLERDRLLALSCGPSDECPFYYARIWSRRARIFANMSILSFTGTVSPGSAGSLTVGLNLSASIFTFCFLPEPSVSFFKKVIVAFLPDYCMVPAETKFSFFYEPILSLNSASRLGISAPRPLSKSSASRITF